MQPPSLPTPVTTPAPTINCLMFDTFASYAEAIPGHEVEQVAETLRDPKAATFAATPDMFQIDSLTDLRRQHLRRKK